MKNSQYRNRTGRKPALSSIGLAVIATLIASGAQAAGTSYDFDNPGAVAATGHHTNISDIGNAVEIRSILDGNAVSIDGTTSAGSSYLIGDNILAATAKGLQANGLTIDLALIQDGSSGDGLASLLLSTNTGDISSRVQNSTLSLVQTDLDSGSVAVKNNTISATTMANQGVSIIAGVVPNGYTSSTKGLTEISTLGGPSTSTATGSIVVSTAQQTINSNSRARLDSNSVLLDLGTTTTASASVTDNKIVASSKANSAANTIAIESAGGNPAFVGSAVIGNTQVNVVQDGNAIRARSYDSTVSAEIGNAFNGGTLAVTGNIISSTNTANDAMGTATAAGNRIVLADGLSFSGAGSTAPGATLNGYGDGSKAAADLVIANIQSNQLDRPGYILDAHVKDGKVTANLRALSDSTVNVSSNSLSTSSTGNAATSAIESVGAARFAGTAALVNQQDNTSTTLDDSFAVHAENSDSTVNARALDVTSSKVSVANNLISASARGNYSGQNLALNANEIDLGNKTAALTSTAPLLGGVAVQAAGAATVSNLQANNNSPVLAENKDSSLGQIADNVAGSTLSVNANTQQAMAVSNNAANTLALNGTSVDSGAGILSVQRLVASNTESLLSGSRAALAAKDVTDSTLLMTNNTQQALGLGNLANNGLSVTATVVAAPVTTAAASTVVFNPASTATKVLGGNVVAAYSVLNDQSALSNVSALATDVFTPVLFAESLARSNAANNDNTLAAEAFGNVGSSSMALNVTNLVVQGAPNAGAASVGNVTSLQAVNGAITAQASANSLANTILIDGDVTASTVSALDNSLNAQATGSQATNALKVIGTNINTGSASSPGNSSARDIFNPDATVSVTNAAFSLQNVQSGQGSVTATLRDNLVPLQPSTLPSDVRISMNSNVVDSTVRAAGNVAMTTATSNNASNTLALDGGSQVASSSALQNVQNSGASVSALIGAAGVLAVPLTPYEFTATPVNENASGASSPGSTQSTGSGSSTSYTYSGWVRTSDSNAANVAGWTQGLAGNSGFYYKEVQNQSTGNVNPTTVAELSYTGTFGGTPGIPNLGGVNLAVSGAVASSTLEVTGNTTQGLAEGNRASNSLVIKGNAILASNGLSVAEVAASSVTTKQTVADHALTNLQSTSGSTDNISSDVFGSFAIKAQPDAAISKSTLSVSGNTQRAEATANTAGNSLALQGTGLTAVSALQSTQRSDAAVLATSDLELFAPGAVSQSSVKFSGNRNIALGTINDAANSLSVAGSQVGTGQPGLINSNGSGTSNSVLTAENLLDNLQSATTDVTSTAKTRLYNQEAFYDGSAVANLTQSTVSILGNTTAAEATANKALNTASVTGTASQTASVALRNVQGSQADVTASATSAVKFAFVPTAAGALNDSSVLLNGNSTTALARGNTASNVLNSLTDSVYGTPLGGSVTSGADGVSIAANAGILNYQANSGAVSASSTAANYQVALNSAVGNSSLGVIGNQVAAQAYGNSAFNQLTLNALNTGTPTSAVGNYQRNSGAVTASVTDVTFGTGITGAVSSSTLRATGNQITATAVGNSVVSSILAR